MNVLLPIPFEQLKDLVDQLPTEEKSELLNHLLSSKNNIEILSPQAKHPVLDTMALDLGDLTAVYSEEIYNETTQHIKSFLDKSFIKNYDVYHSVIFNQLINLQHALFYLEKVESFPFKTLFPIYEGRAFWHFQSIFMIEYAIVAVERLILDKSGDHLTLQNFRDELVEKVTNEAAKAILIDRLKNVKFDENVNLLKKKVSNVRDNYIAHLKKQAHLRPKQNPINLISLKDLKSLLELGHKLFNALSLSTHHYLWIWGYDEKTRTTEKTDFDNLLQAATKTSYLFQPPNPYFPPNFQARHLSEDELNIVNELRIKNGFEPFDKWVDSSEE